MRSVKVTVSVSCGGGYRRCMASGVVMGKHPLEIHFLQVSQSVEILDTLLCLEVVEARLRIQPALVISGSVYDQCSFHLSLPALGYKPNPPP